LSGKSVRQWQSFPSSIEQIAAGATSATQPFIKHAVRQLSSMSPLSYPTRRAYGPPPDAHDAEVDVLLEGVEDLNHSRSKGR
jgi:hypothetical protein